MKKKLIVDISMFILMILEFSKVFTGPFIHELIGIILFILVITHLILNRSYILNITKAKYNTKNTIMLIINILLMVSFILTSIFGFLISQEILTFLNIHKLKIIKIHKVFGYISLIIMGMHLGINFNAMFGKLTNKIKYPIINTCLGVGIVSFGIYSFIKVDFWKRMTGTYGFSIKSGTIYMNILEYLSIIMMVTIIVNFIYKRIGIIKNEKQETSIKSNN